MGVKYLSPEEVAERLGISVQSIYRRRSEGASMPPAIKVGKYLRWREEALDAWMLANEEVAA